MHDNHLLDDAHWLWSDGVGADNTWCGFRRTFQGGDGGPVWLHCFAAMRYKCYVNGRFVNAGPAPFRLPVVMVDSYDISSFLEPGENEVFVLVHSIGRDVKWALAAPPGLLAVISTPTERIVSDASWEAYHLDCWSNETPWINWARERVESIDLRSAGAALLARHAAEDHQSADDAGDPDSCRTAVALRPQVDLTVRPRSVPALGWQRFPAPGLPTVYRSGKECYNHQDFCGRIMLEHLEPALAIDLVDAHRDDGCHLRRERGAAGWALAYDLLAIHCGDCCIEVETDAPCTLDVGFTERWMNGRPEIARSGSHYFMRLSCGVGRQRYRLFAPHGFRYLFLVVKDLEGGIRIAPPTICAGQAALAYDDQFTCSDASLERVYAIGRRAVMTNAQACAYDCVTRELGTYLGDGLWVTDMIGHLTGDASHMRHLLQACIDEYQAVGELNGSLFGTSVPLYDYSLVPAEILRRYCGLVWDEPFVRSALALNEQIIADFDGCRDADGWVTVERLRERTAAIQGENQRGLLFLDHPGLGWHARVTVGIERQDPSAGLQLFHLQAMQACDAVRERLGEPTRYGAAIAAAQATISSAFLDPESGLLADTLVDGQRQGCSQLVNALAVICGILQGADASWAMRRCVDVGRRQDIAQCTPYGYFYVIDALQRCGLTDVALRLIERCWTPMVERGATCTWESFNGEVHDSLNHAWSAILPYGAYRLLLDLRFVDAGCERLSINPAVAAMDRCTVELPLPAGRLAVSWQPVNARQSRLRIETPVPTLCAGHDLAAGSHELLLPRT